MIRFDTLVGPILLLLLAAGSTAAQPPAAAPEPSLAPRWVLEFGPYAGYYDFDQLSDYMDFPVFGLRLGARMSSWLRLEGSFDEVYTEREVSGNRARQVSFGLHARIEPWPWRVAPFALAGVGLVLLDDADDPDAFGQALDTGLGLRWGWTSRWLLRAEWLLRRQDFQLLRSVDDGLGGRELRGEAVTLHGRAYRLGISYVF